MALARATLGIAEVAVTAAVAVGSSELWLALALASLLGTAAGRVEELAVTT